MVHIFINILVYSFIHISRLNNNNKKTTTINPENEDDKCFQYGATVALNYEEIESPPERVSNIKSSINKYNCEGII